MYKKTTLANKLTVITNHMPEFQSFSVAILIGTGSCHEHNNEAGISHFVEHMLFKGTKSRPTAMDITREIEGVGGIINASTDKESTIFWCKAPRKHLSLVLNVFSDMLLNSKFDVNELEKERRVIMEEINMNGDLPQHRVFELMDKLLWPKQPLGKEIIGSRESVSSLQREQFIDYVSRRYLPNNTVISIAGNIQHEQVVEEIESLFGSWAEKNSTRLYTTKEYQNEPMLATERKTIEQAHLCFAMHGYSYRNPLRFSLNLLNTVLGGGMSSRLFNEIRERQGLAYDIHSYLEHYNDTGALIIYAGIDPKNTQQAIDSIYSELSKLKQGISTEELERAKELIKGRLQLRFEDSRSVALWSGSQELFTGQILELTDVFEKIDALSIDDIQQVATSVIIDERMNVALVSPSSAKQSISFLSKKG